jgi:Flp pilus assembly protein TadD
VQSLGLQAEALIALRRFDEAATALQKLAALEPNRAEWRARLGRLLLEKRDFAGAERELFAALQLDAGKTEVLRDLAAVFYFGEKYEQALAAQDQLAKRETPNAGFWFVRATCYDKLKRRPEALEAYKKFLELDQGKNPDRAIQARGRIRAIENELKRK